MRALHLRVLAAMLVAVTVIVPGRSFAAGADTKPVTAALDQLLDAFNRKDSAKFAAAFTEDGDFLDTRGGRVHGRKAISDLVAKIVKNANAGHSAARGETAVKMVKPDVALMFTKLAVKSGAGQQPGSSLATFVLVSTGGKWKISACEIAPGATPPAKK
jgi:uncharacterized protein (TIGR02246 family)